MSDFNDDDAVDDVVEIEEKLDVINMSDEDFMKMPEPPIVTEEQTTTPTPENTDDGVENEVEEGSAPEDASASDKVQDPDETTNETIKNVEVKDKKEDKLADTIDYKSEYEKLIAPFKANGSQMQVRSTDDIITLMQMGANYHKKMLGLKPSLKIMKLLEKNNLLDPDKINYLIDLHIKNPEAITKLIKDSGIDPLDVDVEKENKYVPKSRTVSDTELELDNILEEIQNTPSYSKTLTVLTEKWDDASRSVIAANPHIISVINEHIANGIYDKVYAGVEYERNLGRLKGLSDLDAYKQMGDYMQSQGLLNNQTATKQTNTTVVSATEKVKEDELARKERKKAVSSTRNTSTPTKTEFNPLSMSDEEFAKMSSKNFKL
jgi:hypothetical protein